MYLFWKTTPRTIVFITSNIEISYSSLTIRTVLSATKKIWIPPTLPADHLKCVRKARISTLYASFQALKEKVVVPIPYVQMESLYKSQLIVMKSISDYFFKI